MIPRRLASVSQMASLEFANRYVAESGHFKPNAGSLNDFIVEGEQHYWVHVAIDRFTGKVMDKQIEVVNESAASREDHQQQTTDHARAAIAR